MSQTFLEFKDYARSILTVDGNRYGISVGNAKYFDRQVTAGLLDLQSFIPQLQAGHKETFTVADMTEDGEASTGEIPEGGKITDAYYVTKTCHCIRRPFVPYPWEHRFDLFCGKPRVTGWQYFLSVSPFADKFVIYPKLVGTAELWLYWSGVKGDYLDEDVVRYGPEEAEAVALFVKANICREVDKDLNLHKSYLTSYIGGPGVMGLRSRLFSDWKQRAQSPPASTSPQPEQVTACGCSTLQCCWSGGSCGFFEGFLYLLGPDELWHKITIVDGEEAEEFEIGAGIAEPAWDGCVTASAEGYLFSGGWFHIRNTDSNTWVSISFVGSGSEASIVFGPEKGELGSISVTAIGYKMDPCLLIKNTETGEYCPLNLLEEE